MNCDEAFEQITEPARGMSLDLKWHLDRCPRCRQLREVLQPALSLFGGDDPPREPGHDLPWAGSRQRPLPGHDSIRLAERAASSLSKKCASPVGRPSWGWLVGAACAASLVAGSLLTLGATARLGNDDQHPGRAMSAAVANVCTWQAPESEEGSQPRAVILSCVACHLGDSLK